MPSSGRASGKRSTPPKTSPRLPSRMQVALPSYQSVPSTSISAPKPAARRLRDPLHRYATRPSRSLRSSASRIIAASNPAPAITAKRSLPKRPTSRRRRSPRSPTATARSMSFGIPRLVANRFAVPAGTTARLASEPASTSMHRRTVPSPPQAKTRSAPAPSARRTWSGAFLAFGTSYHSGSSTPARASARRSSGRPPPRRFSAWATTATFMRRAARGATWRCAPGARACDLLRDAGRAAREQQHEQRPDRRSRARRRRRAGGACRGTSAPRRRRPGRGARPPRRRRAARGRGSAT